MRLGHLKCTSLGIEGMAPHGTAADGAAALPAAPAMTADAVRHTTIYKLLAQFSTPKGIVCDIARTAWPTVVGLPLRVKGRIEQWTNQKELRLKVYWLEADGVTEKYDIDFLGHLLDHDFKLIKGSRGEALRLRGTAAREAATAEPKQTIDIKYMDGVVERTQSWTTSYCCSHCSTADKLMVLCDPTLHPACHGAHKAEPECEKHRWRRPSGLKRKRGATFSTARTSPAKRKASFTGTGSRSGASASWDAQSFPPRKRPHARSVDEDEG